MESDRADGLTDGLMDGWMDSWYTEKKREREGISCGPRSPTEENIKTLDYVNLLVNLINYWWTVHQKHSSSMTLSPGGISVSFKPTPVLHFLICNILHSQIRTIFSY